MSFSGMWDIGFPGSPRLSTDLGYGVTTPERQPGGFLLAATADPADFFTKRLQLLDARDRKESRKRKDYRSSTTPLELQIWR